MDIETFCALKDSEVASIVAERGPHTLVCPINGTRRWYLLEHSDGVDSLSANYLDKIGEKYIEIFKLFFDHGIQTVLSPSFGPDLLTREPEYLRMAAEGLGRIASHDDFIQFYEEYGVHAFVYGDYESYLEASEFEHLSAIFDSLNQQTRHGGKNRLFWGMFAHDATDTIAKISIEFYKKNHRAPSRTEIIMAYYGEHVQNVDIFIGFDKFSAFDMPLIRDGTEDLYFLASPTPYLTPGLFRQILFDHLYLRPVEGEYSKLSPDGQAYMRTYYHKHRNTVFGTGKLAFGVWYPSEGSETTNTGRS